VPPDATLFVKCHLMLRFSRPPLLVTMLRLDT
jgi:hypothetical protein